jgi:hypothetical protein
MTETVDEFDDPLLASVYGRVGVNTLLYNIK